MTAFHGSSNDEDPGLAHLDRLAIRGVWEPEPTAREQRRRLLRRLGDAVGILLIAALLLLALYETGVTAPPAKERSVWLVARHPITGAEIRLCSRDKATCEAAITAILKGWWGRDLQNDYALTCEPTVEDCTRGE